MTSHYLNQWWLVYSVATDPVVIFADIYSTEQLLRLGCLESASKKSNNKCCILIFNKISCIVWSDQFEESNHGCINVCDHLYIMNWKTMVLQVKQSRGVLVSNITVMSKWARWRLKSPAARLFAQPFVRVQEITKAPSHWPLLGESIGDRLIPHTKDQ